MKQQNIKIETELVQYITGNVEPEKQKEIEQWLASHTEYAELIPQIKAACQSQMPPDTSETETGWENLKQRIKLECKAGIKNRYIAKKVLAAAAITVMAIVISGLLLFMAQTEIRTGNSKGAQIILPDGSYVYASANTFISYPRYFFGLRPHIHLSGEAWFSITPKREHLFLVSAGLINVKVTGTQFVVTAYDTLQFVSITVKEGSVFVADNNHSASVNLTAGQQLIFNNKTLRFDETKNINLESTNIEKHIFEFKKEPLTSVVQTLENHYHVDIDILIKNPDRIIITANIEIQPVDSVLSFLNRKLYFNLPEDGPFLVKKIKNK